ncbi:MAG: glycosyltransferase family 4 protein [Candidatus Woesearchaeota archaeon]
MKILFILNGHFDNGLELATELQKIAEVHLVIQLEGDKLSQSVFNLNISDIPLGFYSIKELNTDLKFEINKLFALNLNRTYLLKYNSLSLRDLKNLRISKTFTDWIKKNKFNLVHYYGSSLTWVQQAFFLTSIKKIYTIHDYIPHTGDYSGSGYQYKFYMKVITNLKSTHYLLLSKRMQEEFISYYKINPEFCHYIYFGVFGSYLKFSTNKNIKHNYNILFFGRISPYKGIEYLIEATKLLKKEIPKLKTIIAGEGEFYFDIEEIKSDYHFEIYNNYINNEQLANLLTNSSLVVCPYIDATQSGVIMTAYAFNKPVIATDVGSFKEYVIDGVTGFIVPPKNSHKLAEAIKKIIMDKELYNNIVKNIYEIKEQKFSWKKSAEQILTLYNKIL